ncbi:RagB/SusD family nutrient uptake outer membrane protein [Pontibacter diazotrophicus]|uniref:RagB/SusD family nutrient uptake outer membrane protein n=1 Tax=Pontibacter diazotrophicus TaxID=1400979 RepID=A0A3D8LC74_9BACT|nr:RagB/SusD family nutrient uptake outer membrane protein [Pontibacter diazotrophicus]RDV15039.1 RagB/SusD family nutrient uptake outer membrane protein [Pontibacter diazotrophicus]
MKRISKISLVMLCMLEFTACEKQLELSPLGQLDDTTFYQTESDFEAASLSAYSTLINFYFDQSGSIWDEVMLYPSDEVARGQNPNDRNDFNWNANDAQFFNLWRESYKGIQRANVIIDALPKASNFEDEERKVQFEAEAKFVRAYLHFLLATNFGNAPVSMASISTLEGANKPMSDPGEIWDVVISDLKFAQENLPATWESTNTGRVTSGAATAMLGKVYLYRAQWDNNTALYADAVRELSAVVNSGQYSLVPTFSDNFDISKENNVESLFEIQFSRGDFNTWLPVDFGAAANENIGFAGTNRSVVWRPACGPTGLCAPKANGHGYGNMHVLEPLRNAFEPGDPRIQDTYYRAGDPYFDEPYNPLWSFSGATPSKYVRLSDVTEESSPPNFDLNNQRVIRYADVLLMLAEAILLGNNDVAGAAALINQVRRRADPTGTILPDHPADVSQDQMFDWLMHERRVELALEGYRYSDLVRWHRADLIDIKTDVDFGSEAANQAWNERHLLKPIPQRDLDLNEALRQNDGY